ESQSSLARPVGIRRRSTASSPGLADAAPDIAALRRVPDPTACEYCAPKDPALPAIRRLPCDREARPDHGPTSAVSEDCNGAHASPVTDVRRPHLSKTAQGNRARSSQDAAA